MSPRFWQTLLAAEIPPAKSRALLRGLGSRFEDPASILSHPLISHQEAQRAASIDSRLLDRALDDGVQVMIEGDFPESLMLIQDRPPALFAWGDFRTLDEPTIAIVGTRGASVYGKAVATKFGEALARSGATVVSGGALGIDGAAHRGALSAGGKTVAVLAGGVDKVYPAIHAGLFMQIRKSGCLVSQFAIGARPNSYKFLARNRLIAALSTAVLVVEAPTRSGALSTAHAANELGRQVFVVPSNIDNLNFAGSHSLIRDGATLVDHPDQVLESLSLSPVVPVQHSVVSDQAEKILRTLSIEPKSPEFIVERTGLEASEVLSELTLLEIEGKVFRDAGGYALRP